MEIKKGIFNILLFNLWKQFPPILTTKSPQNKAMENKTIWRTMSGHVCLEPRYDSENNRLQSWKGKLRSGYIWDLGCPKGRIKLYHQVNIISPRKIATWRQNDQDSKIQTSATQNKLSPSSPCGPGRLSVKPHLPLAVRMHTRLDLSAPTFLKPQWALQQVRDYQFPSKNVT